MVSQAARSCEPDTLAANAALFVFSAGDKGVGGAEREEEGGGGDVTLEGEGDEDWFVSWFKEAALDWCVFVCRFVYALVCVCVWVCVWTGDVCVWMCGHGFVGGLA